MADQPKFAVEVMPEAELVRAPGNYRTCVEPQFMATTFGPEFVGKPVSRDDFLKAFSPLEG
jgi:hypothetical protein